MDAEPIGEGVQNVLKATAMYDRAIRPRKPAHMKHDMVSKGTSGGLATKIGKKPDAVPIS